VSSDRYDSVGRNKRQPDGNL